MTVETSNAQARKWAAGLWRASVERWSHRTGQDKDYREHVIHPALNSILRERFQGWKCRILEIGCGDGAFLDRGVEHALAGADGAYLGIDISGEQIAVARKRHRDPHVDFMQLDISAPDAVEKLRGRDRWDCLLSVFAVQEIPDLPALLANLRALASPGAFAVIVTVHPDFGRWLLDAGHMQRAPLPENESGTGTSGKGTVSWRWAGEYPIVDEPGEPFHLPYFHRTIGDYRNLLAEAGFHVDSIRELPEPEQQLPQLVFRGISPFREFDMNVYWPRIAEAPSSIAILAHAEERE